MERISSLFFMVALLSYYIPKIFNVRKKNYVKIHILTGVISIIAMCIALIERVGQPDFIKYIGFNIIMISIGATGFLFKKNPKFYRLLHIIFTITFFIYLFIIVSSK